MRARLQQMQMDGTLDDLIEKLMNACSRKTLSPSKTSGSVPAVFHRREVGEGHQQTKFEITTRARFPRLQSVRDLLGLWGSQASDATTRVTWQRSEASGASKVTIWRYLDLDITATLSSPSARRAAAAPDIEYST